VAETEDFLLVWFTGKCAYWHQWKSKSKELAYINTNNHLKAIPKNEDRQQQVSLLDQSQPFLWGRAAHTNCVNWRYTFNLLTTQVTTGLPKFPSDQSATNFSKVTKVLEKAVRLNTNYKLGKCLNWLNGINLNEVGITTSHQVSQPPYQKQY